MVCNGPKNMLSIIVVNILGHDGWKFHRGTTLVACATIVIYYDYSSTIGRLVTFIARVTIVIHIASIIALFSAFISASFCRRKQKSSAAGRCSFCASSAISFHQR